MVYYLFKNNKVLLRLSFSICKKKKKKKKNFKFKTYLKKKKNLTLKDESNLHFFKYGRYL